MLYLFHCPVLMKGSIMDSSPSPLRSAYSRQVNLGINTLQSDEKL